MSNGLLAKLTQGQRERLAYIEFRLYFLGEVRRPDLSSRFGVAPAGATRDFALYKELAPNNIEFDSSSKIYRIGRNFSPAFEHVPERVLSSLSQGFGDGLGGSPKSLIPCEFPMSLNRPFMAVLAPVTRAIHRQCPLSIQYHSMSSGSTTREIIPFALVDNGLRWHVRAFDRKSGEFRDFVITRMEHPTVLENNEVKEYERSSQDIQWTRIVELDLVPHPSHGHPEIIAMDYGMKNRVLRLKARAAVAGYMLRQWSVDCSHDHRLVGPEYRLWLRDSLALYGVANAVLAPGYANPGSIVAPQTDRDR